MHLIYTNGTSEDTLARIHSASIETLSSDEELVILSDYILSIVPPKDALATARRVARACKLSSSRAKRQGIEDTDGLEVRRHPYYVDLNAISGRLSAEVGSLFVETPSESPSSVSGPGPASVVCHYLDGGIIGPPPSNISTTTSCSSASSDYGVWKKPSLVISGDVDLPATFPRLADTLNMKLVSSRIGAASTLKLSFAALTKGLTALSILSFSTAHQESLLPELLQHLEEYAPSHASMAGKGVIGMAPKAYRWVDEMRSIGEAFDTEGCWDGVGAEVYDSFAEVYRTMAEDTALGGEKVGKRTRGTTVEDAAEIIVNRRRVKGD